MKIPYLDNEINYLVSLRNKGELSFYGSKKLEEYNAIKDKLSTITTDTCDTCYCNTATYHHKNLCKAQDRTPPKTD